MRAPVRRHLAATVAAVIVLVLGVACDFAPAADGSAAGQKIPALRMPDALGVNIHFDDPLPGEIDMIVAAGFRVIRTDILCGTSRGSAWTKSDKPHAITFPFGATGSVGVTGFTGKRLPDVAATARAITIELADAPKYLVPAR